MKKVLLTAFASGLLVALSGCGKDKEVVQEAAEAVLPVDVVAEDVGLPMPDNNAPEASETSDEK